MKKNHDKGKQGDIFNGFEPLTEPRKSSVKLGDILKTFEGSRVITERKAHVESILIAIEKAIPRVLEFDKSQRRGVYQWSLKGGGGLIWRRLNSLDEE